MEHRHAYLILAHTNPGQLRNLLGLLDDVRNDIYVHIDSASQMMPDDFNGCCKKSELVFVKRHRLHWGGVSLMRAELELFAEAVKKPHSYCHLISGMDLPIKSNDEIYSFFEEHQGKEFFDLWKLEDHTLMRVRYFTPFPEGSRFFLSNWINHLVKGILKFFRASMNDDVEFHQGSQWVSVTGEFARYIVDNAGWLEKTFRRSTMCDEIFLPTLLFRSPFKDNLFISEEHENHDLSLANMRLIEWNRPGASIRHPWTYTISDLQILTDASHLWARKFDEKKDSAIIEAISQKLK